MEVPWFIEIPIFIPQWVKKWNLMWEESLQFNCCLVSVRLLWTYLTHYSDVTWASSGLESLANGLIIQLLVQASNKGGHQSSTLLALCEGKPLMTIGLPFQRTSNAQSVSISYLHQAQVYFFSEVSEDVARTYWLFLAGSKQLYEWLSPSIHLSVCLSVTPFQLCSFIVSSWNFQELLPMAEVMSMQTVKIRGQRSRSQRSKPNFAVSGP